MGVGGWGGAALSRYRSQVGEIKREREREKIERERERERERQSWMTTLISVSSKHSLVLRGHLVQLLAMRRRGGGKDGGGRREEEQEKEEEEEEGSPLFNQQSCLQPQRPLR